MQSIQALGHHHDAVLTWPCPNPRRYLIGQAAHDSADIYVRPHASEARHQTPTSKVLTSAGGARGGIERRNQKTRHTTVGPITLFDKSFLESLNPDEAAVFGQLFLPVIAPVFLWETRADLKKASRGERTAQELVENLSYKTPAMSGQVTADHGTCCAMELLGSGFPMDGRPVLPGGKPTLVDGKRGVIFSEAPELAAFARWTDGRFVELEHRLAAEWRLSLSNLDLRETSKRYVTLCGLKLVPRTLEEAYNIACGVVDTPGQNYRGLSLLLRTHVEPALHAAILVRWRQAGAPLLGSYAPYARHLLLVDLTFHLAVHAGLVTPKASNRADSFYLYYLPFCMAFVSTDRLHARLAPLFLRDDQAFVPGQVLKADLKRIVDAHAHLTEADLERGLPSILKRPPGASITVNELWDRLLPHWRHRDPPSPRDKQADKELVAKLNADVTAMKSARPLRRLPAPDELDRVVVERRVSPKMGRWWLLPREIFEKEGLLSGRD